MSVKDFFKTEGNVNVSTPKKSLDDLGREYSTDWTTAIFHEIIDYRYNNNNNLQTLITTNHSLTELETILGLPVVSRLTDFTASTVVIMDGEDVRNRKR